MQPIQYQIPGVLNPFENVLSGLKIGAQMADIDAARQQQQANTLKAQALMKKAETEARQATMFQEELTRFKNLPTKTYDDYERMSMLMDPQAAKNLLDFYGAKTKEDVEKDKRKVAQYSHAMEVNPSIAVEMMNKEADDREAAGDKMGARIWRDTAKMAEVNPQAVKDTMLTTYSRVFGKDWTDATIAASATGKTISSDADKKLFGLVDAEGNTIKGTFFVERGKAPQLVKGEVAPEVKKGYAILTPAEAKARGLPTAGYTWQYNQDTNDISALVKPQQAAVQVNLPGQTRPPTALEKQIDEKFAPLAVEWLSGEKSKAASRINQLNAVLNIVETKKRITGPVLGLTPDVVQSFVLTTSKEARANAERVLQEGLRATLGPQFTKVEGEAFLSRAYDQKAPQEDNARRLRSIVSQMQESAKDRDAMVQYMQGPGNGSLQGYKGRVPSIDDFYAAIEEKAPAPAVVQPGGPAMPPGKGGPAMPNAAKAAAVNAALEKYRSK